MSVPGPRGVLMQAIVKTMFVGWADEWVGGGSMKRWRGYMLAMPAMLILGTITSPACAQQEDEQLWLQVNTNVPVADRVRLTLEQIARFSDRQDGLYQTEFGVLASYRVVKGVEFGVGYRKVGAHNGNTGADEDRIRQQVLGTFGPITARRVGPVRQPRKFLPAEQHELGPATRL